MMSDMRHPLKRLKQGRGQGRGSDEEVTILGFEDNSEETNETVEDVTTADELDKDKQRKERKEN